MERDLSLKPRVENQREPKPIQTSTRFSIDEILEHFNNSVNEVKKQFDVADVLQKENKIEECKIIWRSQVVLAEGLLDFYIHEVSKYCMLQMFLGEMPKTQQYNNFLVPLSILKTDISSIEFLDFINERFSREVYLSSESMRRQLNLLGIEFVPVMKKAFSFDDDETASKEGAKIIKELFERRNQIAHQYDMNHLDAVQTDISKEYVEDYILKIEKIVDSINEILKEQIHLHLELNLSST